MSDTHAHTGFSKAIALSVVMASLVAAVPASAGPAAGKPDPAQIARGAKAWADNCARCHNLRSPGELSDEEWTVSVTHMRVRANIPGNVAEDIIAFLKASN